MLLGLTIGILIAGGMVYWAHKDQKRREADAAFQADLMMAAARAKTEAKEREIVNEGTVWYHPIRNQIRLNTPKGTELRFVKTNRIMSPERMERLGYAYIGEL